MLMVIFGAGASHDSSPDFTPQPPSAVVNGRPTTPVNQREAWRPPLAASLFLDSNGVFGHIISNHHYRKLLPILPRLRRPTNGSVEQELELLLAEVNDQAVEDAERRRQLFAVRYYLHDLLKELGNQWLKETSGVTNYVTLLDQIRHLNTGGEPVCLVSFNYDILLDRALLSFGFKETAPEDQPSAHPIFKLLKPHGSVYWARYVDVAPDTRLGIEQVIEQADKIQLTNDYLRADASDPTVIHSFGRPIVPAIAIPVQTKTESTFEWPRSHQTCLEELLPSVTKVLLIGWQAREAHFLQILRERFRRLTHLMIVGRDEADARAILKYFTDEIRKLPSKHSVCSGGFSQFVVAREGNLLFQA
jgi:hypothetical protein